MKIRILLFALFTCSILGCGGGETNVVAVDPSIGVNDFVYGFNESSGAIAVNSAASYYDGIIYGASRVNGKIGNALYFGSPGERVEISLLDHGITFAETKLSIDGWIKLDTLADNSTYHIIGNGEGGVTSFRFQINNGKLQFLVNDNFNWIVLVTGSQTLLPATWYHLAFTYDGNVATTYVNGVIDNTNNISFNMWGVANTLYIGSYPMYPSTGTYLHQLIGIVDELRMSKKVLSPSEINSYYQGTK